MPDAKGLATILIRSLAVAFGFLLLIMVLANYEGKQTYSGDNLLLLMLLAGGLLLIAFGGRWRRAGSEPTGLATGSQRLMNFCADLILFRLLLITIITYNLGFFRSLSSSIGPIAIPLFGIGLLFCYYFVFETVIQRTPAKLLTGTKVVDMDGARPGLGKVALRTVIRFVPFEPFSAFTNKGLWHDTWAGTRVMMEQSTITSKDAEALTSEGAGE